MSITATPSRLSTWVTDRKSEKKELCVVSLNSHLINAIKCEGFHCERQLIRAVESYLQADVEEMSRDLKATLQRLLTVRGACQMLDQR